MSNLTKKALSDSLKHLLAQKPLDKITIKDITEDCGINRQTFYYHFQDLADLVEWTCVQDSEKALANHRHYDSWQEGFLSIFKLMESDKNFIMNIYHSVSLEQLQLYLYRLVFPLLWEVVEEQGKDMLVKKENKDFIANFYKYAFVGLVLDWIKDGMVSDPSLLVEKVSLVLNGTFQVALKNFSGQ